jgi:uncharacterized protein
MNIIGRTEEIKILEDKFVSKESEFVVLYGRRRVGKTFLIREVFKKRFTLQLTGIANATLAQQLTNFNVALAEQYPRYKKQNATNWVEAFTIMKQIIKDSKQKKKIIFIDELPWFDTMHSKFVFALEHFWNSWASARKDVLLIVCGSTASWMLNKLINSKGGLHNRVTQRIKLEPFSLLECEQFIKAKNLQFNRYQLLQLYMTIGGVPFYWNAVSKGKSTQQVIQQLCFENNGLLANEFRNLYRSLFKKAERHEAIVMALTKKSKGLQRDEIASTSKLANGGGLTRLLDELEESGFIRKYVPVGYNKRNCIYQLCDFFSLFHLKFMHDQKQFEKNYWIKKANSQQYKIWSGYAFEQVCLWHVEQIKSALGISGVETETSAWKGNGAQIDLVIDRKDGVINICEMKFTSNEFSIDKKYDLELRNKLDVFSSETQTKKALHLTMITTYGLLNNVYAGNVQQSIGLQTLFT